MPPTGAHASGDTSTDDGVAVFELVPELVLELVPELVLDGVADRVVLLV